MSKTNIVPFGKYKGQPAETLLADREYCDWLMAQPWFSQRFRDVYNVVINYGSEPQDSPEHNRMQARFLDDELLVRLAWTINPADMNAYVGHWEKLMIDARSHFHTLLETEMWREWKRIEDMSYYDNKPKGEVARGNIDSVIEWQSRDRPIVVCDGVKNSQPLSVESRFEHGGWDVIALVRWEFRAAFEPYINLLGQDINGNVSKLDLRHIESIGGWISMAIECKPSMGDDFPSILRQVMGYKAEGSQRIVVVGSFNGEGASLDQVRRIYEKSGVRLILFGEILSELPKVDLGTGESTHGS